MGAWDFLNTTNGNGKKPLNVLVTLCVHRGVDPGMLEPLIILAKCLNPRMVITTKSGDALIDRSRAIVGTTFMQSKEYDVLCFLDDDIIFDPIDVVKICRLAHEKNLGIVGGPYVKKQMNNTNYAVKTFDGEEYIFGDQGACQEVEAVSTGFMAIQKRVFKELLEKLPEELPFCEHGGMDFYPFFKPFPEKLENGRYVYKSEDWAFCSLWRRIGGKVYCDTTTRLKHAGRYLYEDADILRPPKKEFKSLSYLDDGIDLKVKELISND